MQDNQTNRARLAAVSSTPLLAAALQWIKENHSEDASETTTWAQLQDEGFDSLDQVELIMHVEEECGHMIEDAWVEDLETKLEKTLKEMAEIMAAHLSS